eukprot:904205-Pelagomonas_calceolata.AAC.3
MEVWQCVRDGCMVFRGKCAFPCKCWGWPVPYANTTCPRKAPMPQYTGPGFEAQEPPHGAQAHGPKGAGRHYQEERAGEGGGGGAGSHQRPGLCVSAPCMQRVGFVTLATPGQVEHI